MYLVQYCTVLILYDGLLEPMTGVAAVCQSGSGYGMKR
jgi:hypothetical protein